MPILSIYDYYSDVQNSVTLILVILLKIRTKEQYKSAEFLIDDHDSIIY